MRVDPVDQDLSHDSAVNTAVNSDPLIKKQGTFKGLADMLNMVSSSAPCSIV